MDKREPLRPLEHTVEPSSSRLEQRRRTEAEPLYSWEKRGAKLQLHSALSWEWLVDPLALRWSYLRVEKRVIDRFNVALQRSRENKSTFDGYVSSDQDFQSKIQDMKKRFRKEVEDLFQKSQSDVGIRDLPEIYKSNDRLEQVNQSLDCLYSINEFSRQINVYLYYLIKSDRTNITKQHSFFRSCIISIYEQFNDILDFADLQKWRESLEKRKSATEYLQKTLAEFKSMRDKLEKKCYSLLNKEIAVFTEWMRHPDREGIDGDINRQWDILNKQYHMVKKAFQAREAPYYKFFKPSKFVQTFKACEVEARQFEEMCLTQLNQENTNLPQIGVYESFIAICKTIESGNQELAVECQAMIDSVSCFTPFTKKELDVIAGTRRGLCDDLDYIKERFIRDGITKAEKLASDVRKCKHIVKHLIALEKVLWQVNEHLCSIKRKITTSDENAKFFEKRVVELYNGFGTAVKNYLGDMPAQSNKNVVKDINHQMMKIVKWKTLIEAMVKKREELDRACNQPNDSIIQVMGKDEAWEKAPGKKLSALFESCYTAAVDFFDYDSKCLENDNNTFPWKIANDPDMRSKIQEIKKIIEEIDETYNNINYSTSKIKKVNEKSGEEIRNKSIHLYEDLLILSEAFMKAADTREARDKVDEIKRKVGEIQRHAVMVQDYLATLLEPT